MTVVVFYIRCTKCNRVHEVPSDPRAIAAVGRHRCEGCGEVLMISSPNNLPVPYVNKLMEGA